MTRRFYYYIFYIIILLSVFLINGVYANGIPIWYPIEDAIIRSILIFFIFFLGTSIEYGVLVLNFKIEKYEWRFLLKSCYKINFITFPITQIFAYIIYVYALGYFWIYVILIEVLVINIEWGLYKIDFKNRIKSFEIYSNIERFLSKKILIGSIEANCLSFLVGLISFIIPIRWGIIY
ncbi:MAG: hypothetical protein ACFFDF_25875 [Candidatus Odinarchaeota archaeon]